MTVAIARLWSNSKARLIFSLVFGGICLYLALRGVNFTEVFQILAQADPVNIWLAFGITLVNIVLKIWRWKVLLSPIQPKVETGKLSASFLSAQLLNSIFPVRVGEISRVVVIGAKNRQHGFVMGTIFGEKFLDMLAFSMIIAALVFWIPLPPWFSQSTGIFLGLTLFVFIALFLLVLFRATLVSWLERISNRLSERARTRVLQNVRSALSSLEILQQPLGILWLTSLTVLIWITAILTNQAVFWALGLSVPAMGSLLVLAAAQMGHSLPALPGKIGIFEYACVLALQLLSFSQAVGLSYGILLHAVIYLPILLSGLASMVYLQLKGLSIDSGEIPMR